MTKKLFIIFYYNPVDERDFEVLVSTSRIKAKKEFIEKWNRPEMNPEMNEENIIDVYDIENAYDVKAKKYKVKIYA